MNNAQQPFCNLVTDEIKINFDMLYFLMIHKIGANKSSSKIVTVENRFRNFDSKFKQQISVDDLAMERCFLEDHQTGFPQKNMT